MTTRPIQLKSPVVDHVVDTLRAHAFEYGGDSAVEVLLVTLRDVVREQPRLQVATASLEKLPLALELALPEVPALARRLRRVLAQVDDGPKGSSSVTDIVDRELAAIAAEREQLAAVVSLGICAGDRVHVHGLGDRELAAAVAAARRTKGEIALTLSAREEANLRDEDQPAWGAANRLDAVLRRTFGAGTIPQVTPLRVAQSAATVRDARCVLVRAFAAGCDGELIVEEGGEVISQIADAYGRGVTVLLGDDDYADLGRRDYLGVSVLVGLEISTGRSRSGVPPMP